LDLFPWKKENKNPSIKKAILEHTIIENRRTSWAVAIIMFFLNENLITNGENRIPFNKEIEHIYPTMDTISTINFLKQKLTNFDLLNNNIQNKIKHFEFPFKVIEEKTDYGCNNKIAIVEKNNEEYVCKIYKPNKIRYFDNELDIYKTFKNEDFIPELIEYKENWILIKYHKESISINQKLNRLGKLPISISKNIFKNLKKLWAAGFIHMDFHPGNILFYKKNILFIDFEYLYKMNIVDKTFLESPGLIFTDRVEYDAPLHHINYLSFWKKLVGFELHEIVYYPTVVLIMKRLPEYTSYWINKVISKVK